MVTLDPHAATGRDLATAIEAGSLEELFAAATRAFCGWLTHPDDVMPRESRIVELEAADLHGLLLAWLRELLLVFETEGLLFSVAQVKLDPSAAPGVALTGRLWGEPYDAEKHVLKGLVKKVNGQALELRQNGDGWRARLVGGD